MIRSEVGSQKIPKVWEIQLNRREISEIRLQTSNFKHLTSGFDFFLIFKILPIAGRLPHYIHEGDADDSTRHDGRKETQYYAGHYRLQQTAHGFYPQTGKK